ncbi:MAG TPA: hypothetical protein VFE78_23855 [Gemmataceae bacterium]|jgi:titin|nr:hypothetical protein [Gemmataceae bacterium]
MRWPWTVPFRHLFRPTRPVRCPQRRAAVRPRLVRLEDRLAPATLTVTTTADETVTNDAPSVSLREAIISINNAADTGADVTANRVGAYGTNDTINFNIAGTGAQQINLGSALPALAKKVVINGLSQGGATSTNLLIVLNGAGAGASVDGLTLQAGSDGSTVEGLVIQGFTRNGLVLTGTGGNTITDNFIGTNAAGTLAVANAGDGVLINAAAKSNTVGGTTAALANVISGNAFGVVVTGTGTSNNVIEGNTIGLSTSGGALGNTNVGVVILGGATANTVGGTAAGAANTIAAGVEGVLIAQTGTSQNLVAGNMIGTDKTGTVQHGNAIGVAIGAGATANTVGGTTEAAVNVLSGNTYGVAISDSGSSNNTVEGNLIGTNAAGTDKLPNSIGVVVAFGAASNAVGGSATGATNVISGNTYGLVLAGTGTSSNVVSGNFVGTDETGTTNVANSGVGVLIESGASSNTVGGTATGAANVLSFNQAGVFLDGGTTQTNAIQGNLIGTDKTGAVAAGNVYGVLIQNGATANTVGGTVTGAGNTIAFSVIEGVTLLGNSTVGDGILGNSIFSNGSLGIDLGGDGPTANGANPRSFPNDGQNFPTVTGSGNTVSGMLTSVPNKSFTLQFFDTPPGQSAGQGKTLLGTNTVTTDGTGNATFTFTLTIALTAGDTLTATATNVTNNDTSEFSR